MAEIYHKNFISNKLNFLLFILGRPDMLSKIIKSIKQKKSIFLYNNGKHIRDFTYVKDVSEILFKLYKNKKKIENHVMKF